MSDTRLDDLLKDDHAAIIAAVSGKMRADSDMAQVAQQRRLSQAELSDQVLGFWLQGIRSDLALGATAAMEQNMEWLQRFREGHTLPFSNATVHRCFAEISSEIEGRLHSEAERAQYAAYRREAEHLIGSAFPREAEV
jgi:hypothetical protein